MGKKLRKKSITETIKKKFIIIIQILLTVIFFYLLYFFYNEIIANKIKMPFDYKL